ncbi:MAG: hypothetical protein LBL62_06255, partial [Planctomycetaceae bacterium]|nr:hypothetical protein [Planctomycetaceae bacterium]
DNDNPEASTEEIDSYIDIAERIYAHFHKVEKESDGFQVTFLNPEHKLLNDFDMIRRMNCFISVIRVKAKVFDKQFQF